MQERYYLSESWGNELYNLTDGLSKVPRNSPIPIIQRYLDGVMNRREDGHTFQSWEEKKVGGLKLFFGIFTPGYEHKKNGIPPTRVVVGSIGDRALFMRANYTRRVQIVENDNGFDGDEIPVISTDETVEWSIQPREGPIQRAVYNPNIYETLHPDPLNAPPFSSGEIGLGFANLYTRHYQIGLYQNDKFQGIKPLKAPIPWPCEAPLPFNAVEQPGQHFEHLERYWLDAHVEQIPEGVMVEESLKGNLIQAIILPKQVNISKWKELLVDADNSAILDPRMPYLHWFDELGIRAEEIQYPPAYKVDESFTF